MWLETSTVFPRPASRPHHGANLVNTRWIEAVCRFVEDQQVRILQQRCGYRKALLHAK
jgi:hypothetical protein